MTVHSETVPGARYWSMVIRRGYALRIVDPTGRANAATLLFNPHNLLERYNMADTLKAQHTSKLTKGHMLYSDMGRVLLSIVEDTLGWHDPIGGISTPEDVRRQYGESSYQRDRNAFYRSGRELFLIELGKWGLGRQDLVANVNFFSRVHAGADGALEYAAGHGKPGAYVELRAEMDTLVVLNTAPHPMNPAREYAPGAGGAHDPACRARARRRLLHRLSARERAGVREHRDLQLPARPSRSSETKRMSAPRLVTSTLDPDAAARREIVTAGSAWLAELKRGQTLRILDLEGNQAVDTLFYGLARPTEERYCALTTIRAQRNVYLTAGSRLLSGSGNVLLTITADTCGRHDTLGGACAAESNQVRYALDKKPMHSCRDSFLYALAESGYGLGQARSREQHQLLHECAADAGWRLELRGRHQRRRQVRRDARGDGRARARLELPATQQPVQRVQPDARGNDRLGLRAGGREMFKRVLIANRGAIACRVIRTLRRLGVESVAVYSDADRHSLHVAAADRAVRIGEPPAARSYLDVERILAAARETGAEAIHPGYGFLAENDGFAERCERDGLVFVGPTT